MKAPIKIKLEAVLQQTIVDKRVVNWYNFFADLPQRSEWELISS